MDIAVLDDAVNRHDLNRHPFYRAWRAGTLPRAALAFYAGAYADFIGTVELGWRTIGEDDHADTERLHARLWDHFRVAVGTGAEGRRPAAEGDDPADRGRECPEARALGAEARRAFGDRAAAIGALYAFEAQQPHTARSKLDGLRSHYGLSDDEARYFCVHADDYGERERLRGLVQTLKAGEQDRARDACERLCQAMWSALDGVWAPFAAEECAL